MPNDLPYCEWCGLVVHQDDCPVPERDRLREAMDNIIHWKDFWDHNVNEWNASHPSPLTIQSYARSVLALR